MDAEDFAFGCDSHRVLFVVTDQDQNTAAKDAADWAIARSFSALRKATESGKLEGSDNAKGDDQKGGKDDDDKEDDTKGSV